ncbi:coat F domain-containing protein [Halobacteroides halobius DSM 5150]|uniref:Coat F domain-containing protein n=1 Tax=Halobacteroides halobius (strain ATCC 35273 / DSM 5150 / MD-1) TaxID=748449 RepID=L0KAI6_HALHC|nr:spore coat protein [Halobacteroides halobius]AGB41113.1 coat F domain-containing protein [Halobacteroides halobius DSM 5150]
MQLTTKEKDKILDNLSAEEICIQKYETYANHTSDPEIKNLFKSLAQQEKQHAKTLTNMLNGNFQGAQQQGQGQQTQQQPPKQEVVMSNNKNTMEVANMALQTTNATDYSKFSDRQLLQDALLSEKHVSSAYDSSVLESANRQIMQTLEHIQKEEHEHGQQLFEMMNKKGWYTVNPAK